MTIFRAPIALASLAAIVATASPATAARFGSHPRRLEVNGRLYNQQQRINAGVRDGQLTRPEARQLRRDDRGIYREEHQMAKLDGGHITKADQRALNQQENVVSKDIHTERHD